MICVIVTGKKDQAFQDYPALTLRYHAQITALVKLAYRDISIGSGTIFQSETRQIIVSLPAGVTSVFPITVSLSINSASDLSLLAGSPAIDPVVVIPAGSNFGSFSVTASSNSGQPAHILVDGSSVSFTVTQGVITVINRKVDVGLGVSVNHR